MSFQKKIWFGFISAIAIIAWLAITSYQNNKKTRQSMLWAAHANHVLFHSEEILSLTVDLEAGQRGFALTGIDEFLAPTRDAEEKLEKHIATLGELTADNNAQQQRSRALTKLVTEKLLFTERAIKTRKVFGYDSARIMNASMTGKQLTDSIRYLINEIQLEENKLLAERNEFAQTRIDLFNRNFVAMLVTTGAILVLLFYAIYVNLKAREKAESSLREALHKIEGIYNNAPCGYHSVDANGMFVEINNTFLNWLQYRREEVIQKKRFRDIVAPGSLASVDEGFEILKRDGLVRDKEVEITRKDGTSFHILINASALYDENRKFIQSRSTVLDFTEQRKSLMKIEQLNHELESFSYSVSHDLRAPLRSIDGYTQILMEDYAPKLDQEGKRLLDVVVNNARRMARLIDDLLDFSKVSRKELVKTTVNSDSLVNSILSEIRGQEPNRDIEVKIDHLSNCEADPNLLRQVWFNLLSNALKYTRRKQKAIIEISSEQNVNEVVFTIKDNGTGFDMQYSNKLFGVFQRLHRQNDFEGTGVGLAIVHRIVTRHGGRVWAKGEIDNGAVFNFSLPIM
jgi:PAS domain S-box-containing protein